MYAEGNMVHRDLGAVVLTDVTYLNGHWDLTVHELTNLGKVGFGIYTHDRDLFIV